MRVKKQALCWWKEEEGRLEWVVEAHNDETNPLVRKGAEIPHSDPSDTLRILPPYIVIVTIYIPVQPSVTIHPAPSYKTSSNSA